MKRIVLLALGVAFCSAALAQYKWIGADGRVAYGDNPPRDARDVQRIGAASGDREADPLRGAGYETRTAAANFPVVLYAAENCAPCDAARAHLTRRGIPFAERRVAGAADLAEFKRMALGDGVPVVAIGRVRQSGFNAGALDAALDDAGYPRSSQLPRGWQPPAPQPLVSKPEPSSPSQ